MARNSSAGIFDEVQVKRASSNPSHVARMGQRGIQHHAIRRRLTPRRRNMEPGACPT